MGCGDDWPLCNGHWFPPLDFATWIEWGHRLAAALVSVQVVALALMAWVNRKRDGWAGRSRLGMGAVVLLVVQVMLGAVTVWLELPPTTIILHLGTAMSLLALLILLSLGAGSGLDRAFSRRNGPRRGAWALAMFAAVVVMLGGLVANLGAAPLCQGFPLCNGSVLPAGGWGVQLHWIHRLCAYLLVLVVIALPLTTRGRATKTALLAAILAVAQLLVAAVMVLELLPQSWRIAHVALGTAVFGALVAYAYLSGGLEQRDVA